MPKKIQVKIILKTSSVRFSATSEKQYENLIELLAGFIAERTKKRRVRTPKEFIIEKLREAETHISDEDFIHVFKRKYAFKPHGYPSAWFITRAGGKAVIETKTAIEELYELKRVLEIKFKKSIEIKVETD